MTWAPRCFRKSTITEANAFQSVVLHIRVGDLTLRERVTLTGYEHLRIQRNRILRAVSWILLVLIPAWIWMLISNSQTVSRAVILASLALALVTAWIFRPCCPFCKKTLSFSWKGVRIGRYCIECGASYSDEVTRKDSQNATTE